MATLDINGLHELILDMEEMAQLSKDVLDEMLIAGAEVVKNAQAKHAASMLQGPYNKNFVATHGKIGKPHSTIDGRAIPVTFEGTQHGTRAAEIAFINEFGKKSQPARPFVLTANEACADEAVDAEAKVYDAWLKSKNL